MSLTLLDIYNNVTGQAWSVFDTDITTQDEFDSSVLSSIQRALNVLWHSYNFSFRRKQQIINVQQGETSYTKPDGMIAKNGVKLVCGDIVKKLDEVDEPTNMDLTPQKPTGFYILSDKIILNKTPDDNYQLIVTYYSSKMGINNQNVSIFTLKNFDDKLDIPEQFEDLFLRALATKSMVNSIASTTNRSYQPYIYDFIENYRTLISQSCGIEYDKKIEI